MRGQAALEYMFLISVLLIFVGSIFVYAFQNMLITQRTAMAKQTVEKIAETADKVYRMGGGNITVLVTMPEGVVQSRVVNKTIILTLKIGDSTGDAVAFTAANVSGTIPISAGGYKITVASVNKTVRIS